MGIPLPPRGRPADGGLVKVEEALSGLRRLFLDSAPLIYHVEGRPDRIVKTTRVFELIEGGQVEGVTSTITLAECLVLPLRRDDGELAEQFRQRIVRGRNTRYVGVDGVVEEAARLRAIFKLPFFDALQIACAIEARCDGFLTNDRDLVRAPGVKVFVLDDLEP